jgi:hypothetical protein
MGESISADEQKLLEAAVKTADQAASAREFIIGFLAQKYKLGPTAVLAIDGRAVTYTGQDISAGIRPYGIVMSPRGDYAYVANIGAGPGDAETVKRPNGDTLIYQASTNTFAVVAKDGTPRTMFKPTTGADYWAEQKAAAPTFGQRRRSTQEAG